MMLNNITAIINIKLSNDNYDETETDWRWWM